MLKENEAIKYKNLKNKIQCREIVVDRIPLIKKRKVEIQSYQTIFAS